MRGNQKLLKHALRGQEQHRWLIAARKHRSPVVLRDRRSSLVLYFCCCLRLRRAGRHRRGAQKHWSGWRDLNPRPLRPERSALPSCATPRCPGSGAQSNRDSIAEGSPTHVNDGSGRRPMLVTVSGPRGSATWPPAGRRSARANRARYRGRRSRGTTSGRPICAASAHDARRCRS